MEVMEAMAEVEEAMVEVEEHMVATGMEAMVVVTEVEKPEKEEEEEEAMEATEVGREEETLEDETIAATGRIDLLGHRVLTVTVVCLDMRFRGLHCVWAIF